MSLEFDFSTADVVRTEFIVGEGRGKQPKLSLVQANPAARRALTDAAERTWQRMTTIRSEPLAYDPALEYPPVEFLTLSSSEDFASKARYLRDEPNPEQATNASSVLPTISLYSARIRDGHGHKLTAVKSVSNFGRHLERNRFAILFGEVLSLVEGPKFELADDFDFLIDSQNVFVYRHAPFESACNLASAIKDSMGANLTHLGTQLGYVDLDALAQGISDSVRAARALASIRAGRFRHDVQPDRMVEYCKRYRIGHTLENGVLRIEPSYELTFLYLLTRQVLESELVAGEVEVFFASNRRGMK